MIDGIVFVYLISDERILPLKGSVDGWPEALFVVVLSNDKDDIPPFSAGGNGLIVGLDKKINNHLK